MYTHSKDVCTVCISLLTPLPEWTVYWVVFNHSTFGKKTKRLTVSASAQLFMYIYCLIITFCCCCEEQQKMCIFCYSDWPLLDAELEPQTCDKFESDCRAWARVMGLICLVVQHKLKSFKQCIGLIWMSRKTNNNFAQRLNWSRVLRLQLYLRGALTEMLFLDHFASLWSTLLKYHTQIWIKESEFWAVD